MASTRPVTISFLGDMFLGGEYLSYAKTRGHDLLYAFREVQSWLHDPDILVMNLEGPISGDGEKRSGASSLLSNDPAVLELARGRSRVVMNLGNNHTMDQGPNGLERTLRLIEENGYQSVGAGMNREAAEAACFLEVNGARIAFLSFTSEEPFVGSVIAGPDRPGCASMFPPGKAVSRVHAIRKESDTLCVVLHWGHEYYGFPSPDQVMFARELVGAGADLVIGHHPHVVQGLERQNNGLIAYSLGNFFLPPVRMENGRIQTRKRSGREFTVLKTNIEKGHPPGVQMLGGKVRKDYTLAPYTGPELIRFRERIERLSSPIQAEGYDTYWKNYREKRERDLARESVVEAVGRFFRLSPRQLLATLTVEDVRRNWRRLVKAIQN